MIVTASGNSNHFNQSSFVDDRGMWWVYHWETKAIGAGFCVSQASSETEVDDPSPLICDAKEMGNRGQFRVKSLTLKGVTNCFKSQVPCCKLQTCLAKAIAQTTGQNVKLII